MIRSAGLSSGVVLLTMGTMSDRGGDADTPLDVPLTGWRDIVQRVKAAMRESQTTLLAGGVAFYAFLALFPALTVAVSVYSLAASPVQARSQWTAIVEPLPDSAAQLILDQLDTLTSTNSAGLGFAAVVGVVIAMWSASAGMQGLVRAIGVAYGESEDRGLLRSRGLSVVLTVVAIVLVLLSVLLVGVLPAVASALELRGPFSIVVRLAGWVLAAVLVLLFLGVLYGVAPDRRRARWQWLSPGAVVATFLWLLASVLFSVYVTNFGSYNETYGVIGSVMVLLLWLYLSAVAILVGAHLNCELERQTLQDSTTGEPRPLGHREAYAADTVGEPVDGRGSVGAGPGERQ